MALARARSRGEYVADRSTNRDANDPGGGSPDRGDRLVRFRWSLSATAVPGAHPARIEPAALVSTIVSHPASTAARTPWTTSFAVRPS